MKLINLFYKFKAIIFLALILVSSAGYETASSKEELLEEFLYEKFGDRKIDDIEGLWGYKREQEKEPRFYVIIKSEEYLYIEIVAYHPIREFENQISKIYQFFLYLISFQQYQHVPDKYDPKFSDRI